MIRGMPPDSIRRAHLRPQSWSQNKTASGGTLWAVMLLGLVSITWAAAADPTGDGAAGAQRRRQAQELPPPSDREWCAQLTEADELALCEHNAGLCPQTCAPGTHHESAGTVERGFHTSCSTLLELPDGCAHDVSAAEPSMGVQGATQVSDVCPQECSGRGGCAPSVIDAPFLETDDDMSGNGNVVTLVGDACVDSGGLSLSGGAHAEILLDSQFVATGATFSLAMWFLVAQEELYDPVLTDERQRQSKRTLFFHGATFPHYGIEVFLARSAWLDAWSLIVQLEDTRVKYGLDAYSGARPKWVHFALAVDDGHIQVAVDGRVRHGETTAYDHNYTYMG